MITEDTAPRGGPSGDSALRRCTYWSIGTGTFWAATTAATATRSSRRPYWRAWQKTRSLALTPSHLAAPLLRRPYDLRHSGVTWRLNSGVPATEVAAWAGHSVEVLMRVYARCVAGLEDVWTARMEASLRPPSESPGRPDKNGNKKGEGPK